MRRLIAGATLVVGLTGVWAAATRPASAPAEVVRHPATRTIAATSPDSAPPTTTPTTTPTSTAPAAPAVTVRPVPVGAGLVVADAGNSILYDAEPAIRASLGAARFVPHTIGGFGLSVTPEVWRGVFGDDVPADDPAVVVVMLGNRDFSAAAADPVSYRAELADAVGMMTARGARVLWLGLPPLPPSVVDEQGRHVVNALFAELPTRFPGLVRYVSTDTVLGGPDGSFLRSAPTADGRSAPVRKEHADGTPDEHLCPEGAIRVADLVRRELTTMVALPAAPAGWVGGSWRAEVRYDNPHDGCRP